MSFGEKNYEKLEEKRGKCEEKGEKIEEKRKIEVKKVK
jgi:hypothetical protein